MAENWKDRKDYVTTESASYSRPYCHFWVNSNSLAKPSLSASQCMDTEHQAQITMQMDVHCEQCTTFQGKVSQLPRPPHYSHIVGQRACAVNLTLFCRVHAWLRMHLPMQLCRRLLAQGSQKSTSDVIPHVAGVLFYRIGSLPGLKFANYARLTGQQAPETHQFLPPQSSAFKHISLPSTP